jgi:hypothetical protein
MECLACFLGLADENELSVKYLKLNYLLETQVPKTAPASSGAAPPPKMVLIYEAKADHDIDVRTRVPDRILALHYGQCSSSILNEVQAKLPRYHFKVFQPGKSSQVWTWEKLLLSLEPLLSTDVLRIKAVPQQSTLGKALQGQEREIVARKGIDQL